MCEKKTWPVEFLLSGCTLEIEDGAFILEAAEAQGIEMEADCRNGVCGACMSQCEGQVEFATDQHILSDQDISTGRILTCICRVRGPLKLEE